MTATDISTTKVPNHYSFSRWDGQIATINRTTLEYRAYRGGDSDSELDVLRQCAIISETDAIELALDSLKAIMPDQKI